MLQMSFLADQGKLSIKEMAQSNLLLLGKLVCISQQCIKEQNTQIMNHFQKTVFHGIKKICYLSSVPSLLHICNYLIIYRGRTGYGIYDFLNNSMHQADKRYLRYLKSFFKSNWNYR
jgi:hypothetical protein